MGGLVFDEALADRLSRWHSTDAHAMNRALP
jgi:hypothetical protein